MVVMNKPRHHRALWVCLLILLAAPTWAPSSEMSGMLSIGSGWTSNHYEDASGSPTLLGDLMAQLAIQSATESGHTHWRFSAGARGAFALKDENAILASLSWEQGFRLDQGLFVLGAEIDHDYIPKKDRRNYDDASWTRFGGQGYASLRLDGEESSLTFRYQAGYDAFPDHDPDAFTHSLSGRYAIGLEISTILTARIGAGQTLYNERHPVDPAGSPLSGGVQELFVESGLELEHWFSATTGLTLEAGFLRRASNASLYFCGPGETVLLVDGDEAFFDDFDSFSDWHSRAGFTHRTGMVRTGLEIGIRQRVYDARPPFARNDTPDVSGSCSTLRLDLGLSLGLELSETCLVESLLQGFTITSNDEKLESTGFGFRLGLRILL